MISIIDYVEFKEIYNLISGEPEFELYFYNTNDTYMIIKYEKCVTFQKCSDEEDRGEIEYDSLDELYNSILIDDIQLKRDWENIKDILINASDSIVNDKEEIRKNYNIQV